MAGIDSLCDLMGGSGGGAVGDEGFRFTVRVLDKDRVIVDAKKYLGKGHLLRPGTDTSILLHLATDSAKRFTHREVHKKIPFEQATLRNFIRSGLIDQTGPNIFSRKYRITELGMAVLEIAKNKDELLKHFCLQVLRKASDKVDANEFVEFTARSVDPNISRLLRYN